MPSEVLSAGHSSRGSEARPASGPLLACPHTVNWTVKVGVSEDAWAIDSGRGSCLRWTTRCATRFVVARRMDLVFKERPWVLKSTKMVGGGWSIGVDSNTGWIRRRKACSACFYLCCTPHPLHFVVQGTGAAFGHRLSSASRRRLESTRQHWECDQMTTSGRKTTAHHRSYTRGASAGDYSSCLDRIEQLEVLRYSVSGACTCYEEQYIPQ